MVADTYTVWMLMPEGHWEPVRYLDINAAVAYATAQEAAGVAKVLHDLGREVRVSCGGRIVWTTQQT